MRSDMRLPRAVSGWCFWAGFVVFVVVIGVTLAGAGVGVARAEGAAEVLLKVVQFGFAAFVGLFLLGIVCGQVKEMTRIRSRR